MTTKSAIKGRARYQLALRARRLILQGSSAAQAGEELGLSQAQIEDLLTPRVVRESDLNAEAFRDFLHEISSVRPGLQEALPSEPEKGGQFTRAYFRWTKEGCTPDFFSVDRWLTAHGMHIETFFSWCEKRGLCPWARGEEPSWHRS